MPDAERKVTRASRASSTGARSPMGEAVQRFPPMVARFLICREAKKRNIFSRATMRFSRIDRARGNSPSIVAASCRAGPSYVSDTIFGTKGYCFIDANRARAHIKVGHNIVWQSADDARVGDMYQNEHNELIASIRAGKPIYNGDYMTNSSLMAIIGRMATYTGQVITWDKALKSKVELAPSKYEFGPLPVAEVARPGVTKFA